MFAVAGPGLEAGLGPCVLTSGFEVGDDLPATWAVRGPGAALAVVGALVVLDVLVRFARRGEGTPSPAAPARRLVVSGPYRFLRHPMYVATAAVIAGEGLVLRQPILLAGAAVYLAALAAWSARREEPMLARRFGAEYAAYRAAVPGWVPRLTPYRPA